MIKLLISDLDDTLYDWTGFFVPAFYAMADEIARMTGIDEKKLLNEYMAAHQRLGSVEYPYATLELPSIKAYYNNAPAEELKAALGPRSTCSIPSGKAICTFCRAWRKCCAR